MRASNKNMSEKLLKKRHIDSYRTYAELRRAFEKRRHMKSKVEEDFLSLLLLLIMIGSGAVMFVALVLIFMCLF